jgi:hypothetical protein
VRAYASFELFVCFFQKSKYDFCMHCMDVDKSYKYGYEGHPLFKLCECWVGCLKVGMFWVMFMWWKESRQITYLDVLEWDLWFTNPKMLDKQYAQFYKISFCAFENLVQQIMPFIMCSPIFVQDSSDYENCFIYISSWNSTKVDG